MCTDNIYVFYQILKFMSEYFTGTFQYGISKKSEIGLTRQTWGLGLEEREGKETGLASWS